MLEDQYDIVIVIQPTSPLRESYDIDHALELMVQENAPSIVSVCESNKPLYWHHTIEQDGKLKPVYPLEKIVINRQELSLTYMPNGAVFIAKTDYFRNEKTFYTDSTLAYIMHPERSVDIDNRIDFLTAEFLIGE